MWVCAEMLSFASLIKAAAIIIIHKLVQFIFQKRDEGPCNRGKMHLQMKVHHVCMCVSNESQQKHHNPHKLPPSSAFVAIFDKKTQ